MSSEDENSYESDEPQEEVVVVRKRGKAGKDPNKPKRNMSAFFIYSNANRARVKEQNPDIKFGRVVSVVIVSNVDGSSNSGLFRLD